MTASSYIYKSIMFLLSSRKMGRKKSVGSKDEEMAAMPSPSNYVTTETSKPKQRRKVNRSYPVPKELLCKPCEIYYLLYDLWNGQW